MNQSARTIVTIVMDLLIIVALVLVARLVVLFFDQFASGDVGTALLRMTRPLVLPLGIEDLRTPYGGIFSVNTVLTIFALIAGEWVLSLLRRER